MEMPTFRDKKFGETEFKRLESFLCLAYAVCKDIDSTYLAEEPTPWPEDIRMHVAEAYNLIYQFNRPSVYRQINPELFKDIYNDQRPNNSNH